MFSTAKRVAVAKTAATKAKPSKPVDQIAGWEELCALDAASKALGSLVVLKKSVLEDGPIKELLVSRGLATGQKPASLSPVEGDGKGSAYIAKRSTRSALTPDEIELLTEVVGESELDNYVETVEDQPTLLAVNPAYADNDELLRKIDRALRGVKGIPEDFIIQTEPVQKTVVKDEAVSAMFRLAAEKLEQVFDVLVGISIRPVYGAALEKAWELIKPLIPEAAGLPPARSSRERPEPVPVGRARLMRQLKKSAEE